MRRRQRHVQKERRAGFGIVEDEIRGPFGDGRQDLLQRPLRQRWSLQTGLILHQRSRRKQFTRNTNSTIILQKTVGRPVWHVGSKILIKATIRRASRNSLLKDGTPGCPMLIGDLTQHLAPTTRLPTKARQPALLFRRDRPVVSQMPFAKTASAIATTPSQLWQSQSIRSNQRRPPDAHNPGLQRCSPVITTGQQCVS